MIAGWNDLMLPAYRLIAAGLAALIVAAIFRPRSLAERVTAGMVLVPLILRILLIK